MNEIRKIREYLDMTQTEFARWIGGATLNTVQKWEYDERKPPKYLIDLVCFKASKVVYTSTFYMAFTDDEMESSTFDNIRELQDFKKSHNVHDIEYDTWKLIQLPPVLGNDKKYAICDNYNNIISYSDVVDDWCIDTVASHVIII